MEKPGHRNFPGAQLPEILPPVKVVPAQIPFKCSSLSTPINFPEYFFLSVSDFKPKIIYVFFFRPGMNPNIDIAVFILDRMMKGISNPSPRSSVRIEAP